jgi:TonB family protein
LNNLSLNIKKILVNIRYDSKKTLSENKKFILNESSGSLVWTSPKEYELEVLGSNWVVNPNTKFTSIESNKDYYIDQKGKRQLYAVSCPGSKCAATATVEQSGFIGSSFHNIIFTCIDGGYLHPTEMQIFSNKIENNELTLVLSNFFCKGKPKIEYDPEEYYEITLDPTNNFIEPVGTDGVKFDSASDFDLSSFVVNKKQEIDPQKTKEEIQKELLSRKDASNIVPRLYAESLGFKDWKQYQKLFNCPTVKEDKKDNIKCNQDIGDAFKDGWRPGQPVPENLIRKDTKETEPSVGNEENSEFGKRDMAVTDIPGLKPAQFDGDLEKWFADNFVYPKEAKEKGIEGIVEVNFTIDNEGNVVNVESYSDVDDILKKDAIELIKKMPKWVPADQDNNKITSSATLEVEYFLGFE